jgi:hypothetical protein
MTVVDAVVGKLNTIHWHLLVIVVVVGGVGVVVVVRVTDRDTCMVRYGMSNLVINIRNDVAIDR